MYGYRYEKIDFGHSVNFANYATLCAIELKVSEKITYKLPYLFE